MLDDRFLTKMQTIISAIEEREAGQYSSLGDILDKFVNLCRNVLYHVGLSSKAVHDNDLVAAIVDIAEKSKDFAQDQGIVVEQQERAQSEIAQTEKLNLFVDRVKHGSPELNRQI